MTEATSQPSDTPRALLGRFPVLWWSLVALVFALGLAVRLYDLDDAPLDFHPTRQLHSALIARGMYYQTLDGVPDWQRDLAVTQWHAEGEIEPQLFERLVAWTYRLTGGVDLRIPRLYSILFWTLGGVALLWLAVAMAGRDGALVAVLFYMLWPYGAVASRSFQPDPLMVALILWSLWALLRWIRRPTWAWTVAAGLLAGLAIYVKLVAVFFIAPAFALFLLFSQGLRATLRAPKTWVMALLAALPYAVYHINGVYIHNFLVGQFSLRFFPQYWIDPAWYIRWVGEMTRTVSLELALIALVGALLVQRKELRALLLAMWLGYLLYGLTLSHHISTHDYYHLPLYPMVALGLSAATGVALRHVRGPAWIAIPLVTGALLFGMVFKAWDVRSTLKRVDYRVEAQLWEELGKDLGPGAGVVGIFPDYGSALSYYGWIIPTNWMVSDDFALRERAGQTFDPRQLFDEAAAGKSFFIVTLLDEFDRQPVLKDILEASYPVYREGGSYIIYDLRSPSDAQVVPSTQQ